MEGNLEILEGNFDWVPGKKKKKTHFSIHGCHTLMASVNLSPLCKLFFQHRAISNNMSREQSGTNYKTTATQGYSSKEQQQQQQHSRSSSRDSTKTKTKTIVYVEVSSQTGKIFPGS